MKVLMLILVLMTVSMAGVALDTPPTLGTVVVSVDSTAITYTHTGADISAMVLDSFELYVNDLAESISPNPRAWIFIKIFPDASIVSDTIFVREQGSVTWAPTIGN